LKKGTNDPKIASLIVVYSLAKALAINPMEVYDLPAELVTDLLTIHFEMEKLKAEEIEKEMKKASR
jgi:hypothetical protein